VVIYSATPARIKYEFNYSHNDRDWLEEEITLRVKIKDFSIEFL
jgi:hypothetical protein